MHRADADQQEQSGAPARPCVPWHSSDFWEERWPGGLDCSGLWVCDPGLPVQGLCWVECYKKACLRRWGSLFHSFLWCWLLRWLPPWLKYSYSCDCWSKRKKSILTPLQHLADVIVPKRWIDIWDPSQSLTLVLTGWEWCLVGWW